MSVFYKFKSALTFDTIQFDDLHISLQDFKKAVIQQKQLGKNTNFDLQVTNAETNEIYSDETSLIPKNSSLIVVRIPLTGSQKKSWDIGDHLSSKIGVLTSDYMQENAGNIVVKSADLAALNASEEEKIQAMFIQSTAGYDPANYSRMKGGNQCGDPPPTYLCHKCHHPGHWIKDCPITVVPDIKKSSGIPQSFMTPVEDPSVPGALMTPSGTFAVPTIDMQAYKEGKKEKPFIPVEETEVSSKPIIPEDLMCSLCQDLLTDAVMMPCCGNSFCDECIRNILLESEDNQCPDCKEKDTSPETLIPNRFLRNSVNNFCNKTGYKGGGHRTKRTETELPVKSPTIEQDQDIEIIGTISVDSVPKSESMLPYGEKGSAIVVLGSGGISQRSNKFQTNNNQKLPTIHVEHRPPLGRPKIQSDIISKDSQRPIVGNGLRSSPDTIIDIERNKSSPGMPSISHPAPVVRHTGPPPPVPNTSQLPPGYSQQSIQPISTHFAGNVPPIIPNYAPPPVNPMVLPQHMATQSSSVRMYSPYSNQSMFSSQIAGGYRGVSGHHRMRLHHTEHYPDRNIVEDPLEAFERHLREREKQDRLRRNRSRRTRSRSLSRVQSRSRSRPRSRSRSLSKKRFHSKSPLINRKESPQNKRDSRSPINRRSKSNSRNRTHLRSRSRSIIRNSLPRSKSPSPLSNKKKRSISISPTSSAFKKRSRSSSPVTKKPLRLNRSRTRTRSRTRSKSITRSRKRRRSRSRNRSISNRSISRGRSYSRSLSPRGRSFYSPGYSHRPKRHSRSPPRHHLLPSRHRGNFRDNSPYHHPSYYESGEHRNYKRGSRGSRYTRGSARYNVSNYDPGNKYDRYGNSEIYEEKRRFFEPNNDRGYFNNDDHSKSRKDAYYQPISQLEYDQYSNAYGEVPPPGTTDTIPTVGYSPSLSYHDNVGGLYNDRMDKYRPPLEYDEKNSYQGKSNYKDYPVQTEWKKSKDFDREKDHDQHRATENEKINTDAGERKDEYKEKKDKSKRKKKKESDVEKKKKKKIRSNKKEDEIKSEEKQIVKSEDTNEQQLTLADDSETSKAEVKTDGLYGDIEGTSVDTKIIENYGKIDLLEQEKVNIKSDDIILAAVPELSKWEREDVSTPTDEQKTLSKSTEEDDKKIVTNEILKRAENALFQKSTKAISRTEVKTENSTVGLAVTKERDEILMVENAREARKSGNSIQVTVAASGGKSEDESRSSVMTGGRISAKDRLGAKVEEKNFTTTVRSLVEPKIKTRSTPTVKSVVDVKHSSKTESTKTEKTDRWDDSCSKRHEERRKKESRHTDAKHSKHRDSKDNKEKSKSSRKHSEDELKIKKEIKEKEVSKKSKEETNIDNKKEKVQNAIEKTNGNIDVNETVDVNSILEKKRPCLDEANFEPDYDLTSESESEFERKNHNIEAGEQLKKVENVTEKETRSNFDKTLMQKIIEQTNNLSSSDSSSDTSSDSSTERRKRKKRKTRKKRKVKKRKSYSSDSDSDESSESDSDSETKHKRKKKHRHKTKKSRSSKKKKKTKHNK